MCGSIVQISVSRGGIPKRAVLRTHLGEQGIEGDSWAHPRIHGGPDQAVLLIASEVIRDLAAQGYPLFPGALGENLTTEGLDVHQWRIGQRWRVGQALIEFTKVRVPCDTLDVYGPSIKQAIYDKQVKKGDFTSPKWCLSGMYARVLRGGELFAGDPIELVSDLA